MKKIIILCFLYFLIPFSMLEVRAQDSADYLSYDEIMLSSGKLIRYYTEQEKEELLKHTDGKYWVKIVVYIDNKSVDGSYIANTLYSISNTGSTPIEYNLEYSVETNNKVSFSASGSISASGSSNVDKIKKECAAKSAIEYSKTTTESIKEKRTMKLTIEPNSSLLVYLTGELTVTNGGCSMYSWWIKAYSGPFEFVTLKSQFSRMEKKSI